MSKIKTLWARYYLEIEKMLEYKIVDLATGQNYSLTQDEVVFTLEDCVFETTSEKQDVIKVRDIAYYTVKAIILKACEKKFNVSFKGKHNKIVIPHMPYYKIKKI